MHVLWCSVYTTAPLTLGPQPIAHVRLDSPQSRASQRSGAGGLIGRCPMKQEWERGLGVGSEIGKEEEPI